MYERAQQERDSSAHADYARRSIKVHESARYQARKKERERQSEKLRESQQKQSFTKRHRQLKVRSGEVTASDVSSSGDRAQET